MFIGRQRGMRCGAVVLTVLLLTFAGCAGGHDGPEAAGGPPREATPSAGPIYLNERNVLQPGEDGTLPVKVRWVHQLSVPESFYVVGDVIYVSDECLITLSVYSGDEMWRACKADGNGIFSDGGDEIGPAGRNRIRVYTWFNETLLIDTAGHRVMERRNAGGERPRGFKPFPALRDRTYEFDFTGNRLEARDALGRVAWRLRTRRPMIDTLGPVRSPSGSILVTGSGLMVALDHTPPTAPAS